MSRYSALLAHGWSEQALPPSSTPARVLSIDGTKLRVITVDGELTVRLRRSLPVSVGSWLALDDGYRAHIRAVLPWRPSERDVERPTDSTVGEPAERELRLSTTSVSAVDEAALDELVADGLVEMRAEIARLQLELDRVRGEVERLTEEPSRVRTSSHA